MVWRIDPIVKRHAVCFAGRCAILICCLPADMCVFPPANLQSPAPYVTAVSATTAHCCWEPGFLAISFYIRNVSLRRLRCLLRGPRVGWMSWVALQITAGH